MNRAPWIALAIAAVTTGAIGQVPADSGPARARVMLDTYCIGCHNSRARAGNLAFDTLGLDSVHEHADVWEKALRKLRGRLMPPPTSRQPDQREIDAFASWMEAELGLILRAFLY